MTEWIPHILLYPIGRQEFSLRANAQLGLKMCLFKRIGRIILVGSQSFVMKLQPEFWQLGYVLPLVRSHLPARVGSMPF